MITLPSIAGFRAILHSLWHGLFGHRICVLIADPDKIFARPVKVFCECGKDFL